MAVSSKGNSEDHKEFTEYTNIDWDGFFPKLDLSQVLSHLDPRNLTLPGVLNSQAQTQAQINHNPHSHRAVTALAKVSDYQMHTTGIDANGILERTELKLAEQILGYVAQYIKIRVDMTFDGYSLCAVFDPDEMP